MTSTTLLLTHILSSRKKTAPLLKQPGRCTRHIVRTQRFRSHYPREALRKNLRTTSEITPTGLILMMARGFVASTADSRQRSSKRKKKKQSLPNLSRLSTSTLPNLYLTKNVLTVRLSMPRQKKPPARNGRTSLRSSPSLILRSSTMSRFQTIILS